MGEPLFTREDAIQEFARKFPVDDSAANRLRNLPDDQLQRVFNEFNPAQDSNPDYSRRLMGFLKTVTYNTGPPPPGSTAALLAGGGGCGGGFVDPGQYGGPMVSMEQLEMFKLNNPMDEMAYDYLKKAPPDVQERVIQTFRANCVQDDYSRMITAHVRYCMTKRGVPGVPTGLGGGGGGGYQQQHNPNQSTVSVDAAYQAITGTVPLGAAATGAELPQEAVDQFRQQYPMDDRAYEYLRQAPVEVQHRVVTTFKVSGDAGQADYSRAITGHIRFCLNKHRETSSAPMEVPAGMTAEQTLQMIADFQAKYPMDERALQYLLNASAETKQRVLTDFRPVGTVDVDYSKAVTAFVRRSREEEKASSFMGGGGFASMGGGCGGGGGFASMGGGCGGFGSMGGQGSSGSSVEQTARQLVELLGQVGGQGSAGVQQAQHLVQQALQVAADGGPAKRPRLESPMMQGGGMLRPGGGMGGGGGGWGGGGRQTQWGGGGMTGI